MALGGDNSMWAAKLDNDDDSDGEIAGTSDVGVPPPTLRNHGNTGPKGVIQDYKEDLIRKERERGEKMRAIIEQAKRLTITAEPSATEEKEEQDDEERFLREHREKRIREMMESQKKKTKQQTTTTTKEKRKGLSSALSSQSEEATSSLPSNGPTSRPSSSSTSIVPVLCVVVKAGQDVALCDRVNRLLVDVAEQHETVKVCVGLAAALKPSLDKDLLPAFLLYKGGELQNSSFALEQEIGSTFSFDELSEFLRTFGVEDIS